MIPTYRGHEPHSYVWEPINQTVLVVIRKGFSRPKPHPRAWAHRILERVSRGERVPIYAVECAREAAKGFAMREPGQEG